MPFDDGSFDLLLATDVIEHLDDDVAALAELRRVAAPGARLLVTVPAYRWLWGPHDEAHHHKRRYTLTRLRSSLAAGGWRPLTATYFITLLLPRSPPYACCRATVAPTTTCSARHPR